jgi:hypothetical protein
VAQIRDGGPGSVYYLKQGEINDLHEVLAAVMPGHVTDPAPGTAHAQLQRRLLQGNELSLVHTSDLVGGQTYCSVRIGIRAA